MSLLSLNSRFFPEPMRIWGDRLGFPLARQSPVFHKEALVPPQSFPQDRPGFPQLKPSLWETGNP